MELSRNLFGIQSFFPSFDTKDSLFEEIFFHSPTPVDTTEEKNHSSTHQDTLTGLANRLLFEDRLTHALENARRCGKHVGILHCDLNEFTQINDEYGHEAGDRVLVEVAKRLTSFFRSNDTIARFKDDEFAIIVEQLEDDTHFSRIIQALQAKISESIDNLNHPISISIGTASFPLNGLTKEHLLAVADYKLSLNKNQFYGL